MPYLRVVRIVVCLAFIAMLPSCLFSSSSSTSTGSAPNGNRAVPGTIAILAQHCYADPNLPSLEDTDADAIDQGLMNNGWRISEYIHDSTPDFNLQCTGDPAVYSSQFTDSTARSSDALWFSGHGVSNGGPNGAESGIIVLYNYDFNQGCPGSGGYQSKCFAGSGFADPNLPYTGNIKWVFTVASQAVKYAPSNWSPAFNSNGPGLHGFYGYEGEPDDAHGADLAASFLNDEVLNAGRAAPVSIHTAWINAAGADQKPSDYGIELASASGDVFSGTTSPPPYTTYSQASQSNPVDFYDATGQTVFTPPFQTSLSNTSPGYLQAHALAPESWSDSYLASQADSNESGSTKYQASSNQYRMVGASFNASHYESSGAVIMAGARSLVPFNDSQSGALSFAQSELNAHGGLPSDAKLSQVVTHYSRSIYSNTSTIVGYDFIWRHSDGRIGGDFIQVAVDNAKVRYCSQINENDPPYNKPPCLQWSYEYNERCPWLYRLWRGMGGAVNVAVRNVPGPNGRRLTIAASGTGISSQSAYNAALAKPSIKSSKNALGSFVGYALTYWTPSAETVDNTAYPAYHFFFSSHHRVTVNAVSGQVIGAGSY